MKTITTLFLIALIAIPFLVGIEGCQTTRTNFFYDSNGNYVEIINPPEQCVLYRVLKGNTEIYKAGLFVMNYAALKAGFYTGEQAAGELDKIEAEITRPGATVGSVINTLAIIAARATKVGAPEIVLLTDGLNPFKADMTPLDDCTRYKLINYIGGQRNLSLAFAAK